MRGIHYLVNVNSAVAVAVGCCHGCVAERNAALACDADKHVLAVLIAQAEYAAAVVFVIEIAAGIADNAANAVVFIALCVEELNKLGLADVVGLDLYQRNAAGLGVIGAVEIQIALGFEICR